MKKTSSKSKILRILSKGYAVRSGVYSVVDPSISMRMNEYGEYYPVLPKKIPEHVYESLLKVDMMSDESDSEDEIASKLFSHIKDVKYNQILGYYTSLYAGHVLEGNYREKGSSGGFTSWILAELLRSGKIDAAIHAVAVNPDKNDGVLFKYTISRSIGDIGKGAKSRYYPLELSEVLSEVLAKPGSYAVVGIPEFITELRLASDVNPVVKERIKYMIGLVCGHQKTAKYAEALAWQQGIKPGDLSSVDFRIKQPEGTAYEYLQEFKGKVDGKEKTLLLSHDKLLIDDWALGFFKSKFSDFTDNTFNETADVVLGDAWLDEYNPDGMGNNIVIVRNPEIDQIIKDALRSGKLKIDSVDAEVIKWSQSGLIHHTRDELPYRLSKNRKLGGWIPKKRIQPSSDLPELRKRVQDLRYETALMSHVWYKRAVTMNNWHYFEKNVQRQLHRYKALYQQIAEGEVAERFVDKLHFRNGIKGLLGRLKQKIRIRTRIRKLKSNQDYKRNIRLERATYDGAIVTLPGNYNYGNLVQKYALQKFLLDHGVKVRIIDMIRINDDSSSEIYGELQRFFNESLDTVPFEQVKHVTYRNYIIGSDQIWRNWYDWVQHLLYNNFIDFIPLKKTNKISYAASFGVDSLEEAGYSKDVVKNVRPLLEDFSALSVREESAIGLVRELVGKPDLDVELVLDPTLLLTREDYSMIIDASTYRTQDVPKCLAYVLDESGDKGRMIASIAQDFDDNYKIIAPKDGYPYESVESWLKGFRDAEFIITDSFHGTVFSIINNKPFIVIANKKRGLSRMENLLEITGISRDRLVFEEELSSFNKDKVSEIDWSQVNKNLELMRADSGDWLLRNIVPKRKI